MRGKLPDCSRGFSPAAAAQYIQKVQDQAQEILALRHQLEVIQAAEKIVENTEKPWALIGTNEKWNIYTYTLEGGEPVFNVSKDGPPKTDGGYYDVWSLHMKRGMNPGKYQPIKK